MPCRVIVQKKKKKKKKKKISQKKYHTGTINKIPIQARQRKA